MQCKDIDDAPILVFLANLPEYEVASSFWDWDGGIRFTYDLMDAFPSNTPRKLCLSKMYKLIRRGLVHGCWCGCRGDFTLTDKGFEYVAIRAGLLPPTFTAKGA